MPPWGIVGRIVLAYVHSQMNPQRCTKFGANRSSLLTASQDFWICDPTPRHAPWGIEGPLVFSLYPFPDASADVNQSWCQSVQPFHSFPWPLIVWPPKTPPSAPLVSLGAICLAYIHSQMNLQIWCQSDQPFESSPDFLICDPLITTASPPMSRGELYLAYVQSQTNPQTCTKFGANRSSRLTASQTFGFVTH